MLTSHNFHWNIWVQFAHMLHLCISAQLLRLSEVREPRVHLKQHLDLPRRLHYMCILIVLQMCTNLGSRILHCCNVEIVTRLRRHLFPSLTTLCGCLYLLPDISGLVKVFPWLVEVIPPTVLLMLGLLRVLSNLRNMNQITVFRFVLILLIHQAMEAIRACDLDRGAIVLAIWSVFQPQRCFLIRKHLMLLVLEPFSPLCLLLERRAPRIVVYRYFPSGLELLVLLLWVLLLVEYLCLAYPKEGGKLFALLEIWN